MQAIAIQQHSVRLVRQEKNQCFANDGSLESVRRQIDKLTFKFHARVAKLGIGMTEDDVRQEILLAYVKARAKWRPEGGALFTTYFQTTAQNEFNRRIERSVMDRTEMGMVSYHDVMAGVTDEETGDPLEFLPTGEAEDSPEDACVRREEFMERMRSLSEGARKLMMALIADERARSAGKPPRLREIAKKLAMEPDEIRRIKVELFNRFGTTFV